MTDAQEPSDVVLFHHDGVAARRTIERLSRAGVDGSAITLLGPVEVRTDGRYGDRQTDRGSAMALGGRLVRGIVYGSVPGAAFGAVLLAFVAGPGMLAVTSGVAGGAMFGGGVGILASLLNAPTMVTGWERTFSPLVPGGVVVGVRVADPRVRARVERALPAAAHHHRVDVADLDALPDGPLTPELLELLEE